MDKRSDDTDPQQAARRAGIELANQIYFSRQSERAEEAFALVENAQTEARALYLLGLFYYAGFGCEKEVSKSIHYHQQAAAAGEADAMFELYVFYIKGVGVPADPAQAVKWCQLAAASGSSRAMANLGGFYATGDGVPQDLAQAVFWYDRAAHSGSGRAAATLGVMFAIGDGTAQSDEEALRYFQIAERLRFDWRAFAAECGLEVSPPKEEPNGQAD
jgi:TPR repeat protein